jgi:hypothetical protein
MKRYKGEKVLIFVFETNLESFVPLSLCTVKKQNCVSKFGDICAFFANNPAIRSCIIWITDGVVKYIRHK